MRILQLAPRFPFPPDDGGKIGIANITKEFSRQGADVTFFCYQDNGWDNEEPALEEARRYCKPLIFGHSTKNTLWRIAKTYVTHKSIYLTKHISPAVKDYMKNLVTENDFDVIHIDHSAMAPLGLYVKSLINKPVGLRMHNIEYMIWKRYAERLRRWGPARFYINKQANLLKKAEEGFFSKMDVCFAITEADKKHALEMAPDANIVLASAGVNPDEWQPDPGIERNPFELTHATVYKWRHNIDALKWFLDNVLPELQKDIPGIKLTLIGKEAPEWLGSYASLGADPVGYVDRVQPYHNRANIYIAPLFVGGGIRIKILEAMAMELPVVATSVAAEGIDAGPDEGLFIADTPGEFLKIITELANDFTTARNAGKKAREFILNNFSWEKNVAMMMDSYRKLLENRSPV